MHLHFIDIAIIVAYLVTSVSVGYWVSHRASRDIRAYFLGGNVMPWYVLGISNASGMFDISGTMLLVYWMFIYGLKSVWIPWLWPTFNQVFLMVYLSAWLRRSNVMTGAEWIKTRFGTGRGAQLAHLIVVVYAFVSIIGFFSYGFKGIGKFAATFLPWHLSPNQYATILIAITAIYVIKGGMFSVVITEVIQFCILSIASFAVGIIAMAKVAPGTLQHFVPAGWDQLFFGWKLNLDWSALITSANAKIAEDGYGIFGFFVMMLLFKGVLISMAGPAPNYDMQRVLSSKNPREACMMSSWVNVVLTFPRYFLITGLTVLALVFFSDQIRAMGTNMDFELVLPYALGRFVPAGLLGFLIAGLLAAFMSNFAATVNAAPPYFVNDIYKRFINPNAGGKKEVALSRIVSLVFLAIGITFGLITDRITDVMMWLVGGLYGGFVMANVLKWYWWRFNGYGYFWGMTAGIVSAMLLPKSAFFPGIAELAGIHVSNAIYLIPAVIACSLVGCLAGTFWSKADDEAVLKKFYKQVNPWGWWGPIRAKVMAEDPGFVPNRNAAHDLTNVAVGIVWQLCLVTLAIFVVLQQWAISAGILALLVVTSCFMKFNWYDKLEKAPPAPAKA